MKTKNKTFVWPCGALLLAMAACNDFLDENPRSANTSAAYYRNESQARENITAMYRRGAPNRYALTGTYISSTASTNTVLTGYFTNNYEGQELISQYARLLTRQQQLRTVSNTMNGIWNESYQVINIANGAIKYIPGIAMAEGEKQRLIAEAKFFRAFNYFYLVKTFGAVPLTTEPYESLEDIFVPRTEPARIYELMESDLKEAVDVLPNAMFTKNGFRLTKHVAAMALANVYLQQGKYTDAAASAEIVINSAHGLAQHDDLSLGSAFNKLRTEDDLPEVIYSYEFNETISNGNWPAIAFNSTAQAIFNTYAVFERPYGPINRFLNVYEADDLRIQPNQFYHWEYTNPDNGLKWSSTNSAGIWYFYDEEAVLRTRRGTKDWNIYRYAEALLIAAEARARSANAVDATTAGHLAQIKARADTKGKTAAQYTAELQALTVDKFVEECWIERLRELPLEFKMWDDCLRTGMFPVISETVKGAVSFVPLVGAQNASGATFKDSDLLWPISMDELQRNPQLTQNPGYQR